MRVATIMLAPLLLAAPAPAQELASEAWANASRASYTSCALYLDGLRVKRGTAGTDVGTIRWPRDLAKAVRGDSALSYARTFARNGARGNGIALASGLLWAAGYFIARPCFSIASTCTNGRSTVGVSLTVDGLIGSLVALPYQRRARRAAAQAIWWHNAAFAQP